MFTQTQIEAAAETLGTPFNYPELEALRKIALWSLLHRPVQAIPPSPRKPRRRAEHMLEKSEDVITSNEPPCVLMQRRGYSIATIRAIKAGYPPYRVFGGCREFWRSYKRQHGDAITGLLRQIRH
jgi:hypothetical protein